MQCKDIDAPIWACKTALDLVINAGIFPKPDSPLELAIFASLWFDTRGPFLEWGKNGNTACSNRKAMRSLPDNKAFPKTAIRPFLKAELDWHKIIMAKQEIKNYPKRKL